MSCGTTPGFCDASGSYANTRSTGAYTRPVKSARPVKSIGSRMRTSAIAGATRWRKRDQSAISATHTTRYNVSDIQAQHSGAAPALGRRKYRRPHGTTSAAQGGRRPPPGPADGRAPAGHLWGGAGPPAAPLHYEAMNRREFLGVTAATAVM